MSEITSIKKEKCLEELTCQICFEILEDPVMELPNQHILCSKCFDDCNKKKLKRVCPFCKVEVEQLIKPRFILNMLNAVEMKCLSNFQDKTCEWKGNATEYYIHIKNCEILINSKKEQIKNICNQMREALSKEITPHLKSEHLEIFNEYVREWEWLENDQRDWKWWWWSNNPWWHNQPCKECNRLWHKYDNEIKQYEHLRVDKLKSLE